MIYLFLCESDFLQNEESLKKMSQGSYIRVEEMRRERCVEGMPGLLLASPIDVISASLEAKKQESAIEWSRLQQPSRVPLGIVWFFLFLDKRSIISSVQVPLGHLSLSVLRPFRSTLLFIVRNNRAHRNERNIMYIFSLFYCLCLVFLISPTRCFLSVGSAR